MLESGRWISDRFGMKMEDSGMSITVGMGGIKRKYTANKKSEKEPLPARTTRIGDTQMYTWGSLQLRQMISTVIYYRMLIEKTSTWQVTHGLTKIVSLEEADVTNTRTQPDS